MALTQPTVWKDVDNQAKRISFKNVKFLASTTFYTGSWVNYSDGYVIKPMGSTAGEVPLGYINYLEGGKLVVGSSDQVVSEVVIVVPTFAYLPIKSQGTGATQFPADIPDTKLLYFTDDGELQFSKTVSGTDRTYAHAVFLGHPGREVDNKSTYLVKIISTLAGS